MIVLCGCENREGKKGVRRRTRESNRRKRDV